MADNMRPNLLPLAIEQYLRAWVLRQWRLSLLRALGRAVAVALVGVLLCCLADRFWPMPPGVRITLLAFLVLAMAIVIGRIVVSYRQEKQQWLTATLWAEKLDPSLRGRLHTAVSQLLAPEEARGSPALLQTIVVEVCDLLPLRNPAAQLPLRLAGRPWAIAGTALILGLAMTQLSWLGLPQLLSRLIDPLAQIDPVTTTRLAVEPGSVDLAQGNALTVAVTAQRLGNAIPYLHVSVDGKTWSRFRMARGNDAFVHQLDSTSADFQYFVSGGDARTRPFDVHILRAPIINEFRIHYVYPRYTNRPPLTVSNRTGLIEAPTGTEATVTLICSEPLAQAVLQIGDRTLAMTATADNHARQTSLIVDEAEYYTVHLTTDRGVSGGEGIRHAIRALADRPPLVRLVQPAAGLRPGPGDRLPVAYQAMDDYGVAELALVATINDGKPIRVPLKISEKSTRQEDTYPLDLSTLHVKTGDVVQMNIEARDGAGQTAVSATMMALVSPRAIDSNAQQRVTELVSAQSLAARLRAEWDSARSTFVRTDRQPQRGPAYSATIAQVHRNMSNSVELAARLRQSLLEAIKRSRSADMSNTLAVLLDDSQRRIDVAESMLGTIDDPLVYIQQLNDGADATQKMVEMLTLIASAERAAAVDAERENVAVVMARAAEPSYPQALKQAAQNLSDQYQAALTAIGIAPAAPDVAAQLQRRIATADAIMRNQKPVDFTTPAWEWASRLAPSSREDDGFAARLATAAEAQALRPDGDPSLAQDLQLAADAVERINRGLVLPTTRPSDPAPRQLFPPALTDVLQFHAAQKAQPSAADLPQRRQMALIARQRLVQWAGRDNPLAPGPSEVLAGRIPTTIDGLDSPRTAPGAGTIAQADGQPAVNGATIDTNATKPAADFEDTPWAGMLPENDFVDPSIADSSSADPWADGTKMPAVGSNPHWRTDATRAIQAAQETLTAMPQALSLVAHLDRQRREAAARVMNIQSENVSADIRPAISRAVQQAMREESDVQHQLADAGVSLQPAAAEAIGRQLAPFEPATHAGIAALNTALAPALGDLKKAMETPNVDALEQAASQARSAIKKVQKELAQAQDQLIEQDPLVAAKWFAQATRQSKNQGEAAMQSNIWLTPAGDEWGKALAKSPPPREDDLPEFQQTIQTYFDVLGKIQGE